MLIPVEKHIIVEINYFMLQLMKFSIINYEAITVSNGYTAFDRLGISNL